MSNTNLRPIRFLITFLVCIAGLAFTQLWTQAFASRPSTWKWPVQEMGAAQIAISGKQPGDWFGDVLATGDFNGDGSADLLIGAPFLSEDLSHYSEVYLIPGPLPIGELITVPQHTAITFWHQHYENHIGRYIESGDFNDDGYDDIALGLWPAGITIVYPGNAEISAENPQTIFPFRGDMALTIQTASGGIAVCNINGDGYDDLFVEDLMNDTALLKLRVWGVLGSPTITLTNPMTIDLQNDGADFLIVGQNLDGWGEPTNHNIACGDIDGDGVDDLAIGAFMESPEKREGAGRVYIIQGDTSITTTHPITLQMPVGAGAVIQGMDGGQYGDGDRFGSTIAAGDTDGDGRDDLLLGAPGAHGPNDSITHAGEISLWLGRKLEGQTFDTDTQMQWKLHGTIPYTGLGGRAFDAADLDNDGKNEVLIGCLNCEGRPPWPLTAGRGLVIENDLPGGWHPIGESASFYAYVDTSMYYFGSSSASADMDGDGFSDMIFGAPNHDIGDPNLDPDVPGRVYIIPYPIRYKLYFPSIANFQQ